MRSTRETGYAKRATGNCCGRWTSTSSNGKRDGRCGDLRADRRSRRLPSAATFGAAWLPHGRLVLRRAPPTTRLCRWDRATRTPPTARHRAHGSEEIARRSLDRARASTAGVHLPLSLLLTKQVTTSANTRQRDVNSGPAPSPGAGRLLFGRPFGPQVYEYPKCRRYNARNRADRSHGRRSAPRNPRSGDGRHRAAAAAWCYRSDGRCCRPDFVTERSGDPSDIAWTARAAGGSWLRTR